MVIVRATRKLLQRLGPVTAVEEQESTSLLGDWYATVLPWRPRQVALMVSQTTLLPVLMPLAPAATLLDRFPEHLAAVLRAHQVPETVVQQEAAETADHTLATTASRSLTGSMNEFAYLAEAHRAADRDPALLALSLKLATVPCGPLYARHVSPDRELTALLQNVT
ncbi:hypothetical protein AVL62_16260 [Serinicoccus chungangensis]|uniref:DUF6933 domain-containing protein n=1 Tax=Serinicoccus chungangensis TaxID=767452 RepID=A0A0W8I934_9MICO|nr:hypothetical protein [Serinicoccus chungangensis]KUG56325.1 hypothetical protein AVL62_16260 [Serinicoccus chungangensis]